jgi:signal transduction histidine kinase
MKSSLASRLSALYATLLGITVVIVILASSIALVVELNGVTNDLIIVKHDEARFIAEQYHDQHMSLAQAAPELLRSLGGIGVRISIFDEHGKFLAGDPTLRPNALARIVAGPRPPLRTAFQPGVGGPPPFEAPGRRPSNLPPGARGGGAGSLAMRYGFGLTEVEGGYVAFSASIPLILTSLIPYWRVVLTIAVVAIALSWFVGRVFAVQALRPVNEVAGSLQALADGDFTQRQFITATGDEIGELTKAYNAAVVSVANAMNDRRETEARMRQFVADAGHELRTPLTVIGGYIDVLRRGAMEEPTIARQILGTMAIEKEHMRGLIDRLMRLARLDAETPPRQEPIDIAELLRSQCEAARRLDETRQVDYSVDGVDTIVGDRGELGEALWNVVENALKYAPDAPIHLRGVRDGESTLITVRDEGPGMTESERLHAFERFYRGDQRGEITGTGLGLAIARRAVERGGGSIELDSAPGRGTTVKIVFGPRPNSA